MKKTVYQKRGALLKGLAVILMISLLLLCTSCGKAASENTNANSSGGTNKSSSVSSSKSESTEDKLVGSWYINGKTSITRDGTRGPAFTLYDGGVCEIATEYGKGGWSISTDNLLTLKNIYGEEESRTILSIENGCLIIDDGRGGTVTYYNYLMATGDETDKENVPSDTDESQVFAEIISMADFHDGLAWIKYKDHENQYWACIDKKGNIVFQYNTNELTNVTDFSKNYAHLTGDDTLYTIDKTGKIIAQYDQKSVICYGDGYILTEKNNSSFDSTTFEYTIYDAQGNIIEQFSRDESIYSANYCGEGVFGFQLLPNYGYPTDYFCVNNLKWVTADSSKIPQFCQDIALISTIYEDYSDGRKGGIRVMSSSGDVYDLISDKLYDWAVYPTVIIDNVCTVYDSGALISLNISEGGRQLEGSYVLEDKYSERLVGGQVRIGSPEPETYTIHDERIVLQLRGDDGNRYSGIFDKQFHLVFGPIVGVSSAYHDGLLAITSEDSTSLYDVNGNVVYSLTEKGFSSSNSYSDGAIMVSDSNNQKFYLDKKGELLFDDINFKDAKTLYIHE